MIENLRLSPTELEERGAGCTAREIAQQPAVWRETGRIVSSMRDDIQGFIEPLLGHTDLRIILTGAGTSAFAGEILAPALSRRLGRRVDAVATTDIVSNPEECLAEDLPTLLVSFARSGNSPESVAATEIADRLLSECYHLIFTCDEAGRLHRDRSNTEKSLVLLMPEAANDQGFAMTSSFTSMTLAAWLVLGNVEPDDLVERLAASAEQVLATRYGDIQNLASSGYERVVYIGSGSMKGLAHESSLKLLELTAGAVVTHFESPLGFRHGPKSILDDLTLAVVYISGDPDTRKYDIDLFAELRSSMRPGSIIAISADIGAEPANSDVWLLEGLEDVEDAALSLPYVLIAQLLGLSFSLNLGYTPDNPFPGGEVNRVVQGVTIHPTRQGD